MVGRASSTGSGPSLAPSTSSLPRDTQPSWPWALLGLQDQSSAYLITVLGLLLVTGLLFSPGAQGLAPRQWEMAPAHSSGTSDLAPAPGPLEVSSAERTMWTEAPSCAVTAAGGHFCKPALWCKNYLGIKSTSPLLTTWETHRTARVCESGVDLLQTHTTNPHMQLDNHLSSTLPPMEPKSREAWPAAACGVSKSRTHLSHGRATTIEKFDVSRFE